MNHHEIVTAEDLMSELLKPGPEKYACIDRIPAEHDFEKVAAAIPEVQALFNEARAHHSDDGPVFCANEAFHWRGGLKDRIFALLSPSDYRCDCVRQAVWDALPACRRCSCCSEEEYYEGRRMLGLETLDTEY